MSSSSPARSVTSLKMGLPNDVLLRESEPRSHDASAAGAYRWLVAEEEDEEEGEEEKNGVMSHCSPAASSLSNASSSELEDPDLGAPPAAQDMVIAVKALLESLGEDVHRVGLLKTPARVARAFAFATKGYRQVAQEIVGGALFPEAGVEAGYGCGGGCGGMVVVRNIDLFSLCESCLLPFKICCHVAYISSNLQVVGLSKLSRVADMFARRLQNPHRLAEEISQGLADTIKPLGVAVVLQSWHLPVPGVHDNENSARICCAHNMFLHSLPTFAGKGEFEDRNSDVWSEFLAILQLEGISVDHPENADCNRLTKSVWCPCLALDKDASAVNSLTSKVASNGFISRGAYENGTFHSSSISGESDSAMVAAVEAILHAIGKDVSKEELRLTPKHFAAWILNFKRQNQESDCLGKVNDANGTNVAMNGHSLKFPSKAELIGNSFLTELDAPFCSLCEHHLLPFYGKAHVGYFSTEAEEVLDRSAVLGIVEVLSQRLQVQERLTRQIAETIIHRYNVQSIMVVLEAIHVCMVSRGIEKLGTSTVTVAVFGHFATDVLSKAAFLKKIAGRPVKMTCA